MYHREEWRARLAPLGAGFPTSQYEAIHTIHSRLKGEPIQLVLKWFNDWFRPRLRAAALRVCLAGLEEAVDLADSGAVLNRVVRIVK